MRQKRSGQILFNSLSFLC